MDVGAQKALSRRFTGEKGGNKTRLRREAVGAEGCEGGGRILSLAVSLPSKPWAGGNETYAVKSNSKPADY